jgi:hypothetical protein
VIAQLCDGVKGGIVAMSWCGADGESVGLGMTTAAVSWSSFEKQISISFVSAFWDRLSLYSVMVTDKFTLPLNFSLFEWFSNSVAQ